MRVAGWASENTVRKNKRGRPLQSLTKPGCPCYDIGRAQYIIEPPPCIPYPYPNSICYRYDCDGWWWGWGRGWCYGWGWGVNW
jgi:hypothetical protein